jgi:hypothetical protein
MIFVLIDLPIMELRELAIAQVCRVRNLADTGLGESSSCFVTNDYGADSGPEVMNVEQACESAFEEARYCGTKLRLTPDG